ncbi:hypothetical protein MHK_001008 [Candidatus Magnetomorum sp. HK-1]|nr:hypothetical protein MHK_001008 [Candidatus Magnetomorum sp. HK-1]
MKECFNDDIIARYIVNQLSRKEIKVFEMHLSECEQCRSNLDIIKANLSDPDLAEYEPVSSEFAKNAMKKVKARFTTVKKKIYQLTESIIEFWTTPPLQLNYAYQTKRRSDDSQDFNNIFISFQKIIEDDIQVEMKISKQKNNRYAFLIKLTQTHKPLTKTRLYFLRQGSGPISKSYEKEFESFPNLPEGKYEFIIENQLSKQTYSIVFSINEEGFYEHERKNDLS